MYILLYLSINIDMTIIQICVKLYVYMMNSYILSVVQTDMNRYNNINIFNNKIYNNRYCQIAFL